ncbi:nucleoporin GLE1 isoform X2 [Folsomia candida]|uniref:nucleoporin GLE1 isoform X2 n=1 Tax=Folsomia candida TaxID=158441 RepID=UPI000B9074B1|nr:nucleoporin GLE1 isoform X2 [Folsomia candida]
MTSPSSQPQNRRGSMKHGEILNVLRNSPKGQLHYDTGWDEMGYYAVANLISTTQAEEDSVKIAVIERVIRVTKWSEERQALRDSEVSPVGTSSGSGSRLTLCENGYHRRRSTNNNGIDEDSPDSLCIKPRRRGYGIREDEYDDEAIERDFQMQQMTDQVNHIEAHLRHYNERLIQTANKNSQKQKDKIFKDLNESLEALNVSLEDTDIKYRANLSRQSLRNLELEAQVLADVSAKETLWQTENEALDREFELKKKHKREQKAKENAAAQAREAAAKAAEERERQLKVQQEQAAADAEALIARQKLEVDEARKQEETLLAQQETLLAAAAAVEQQTKQAQSKPEAATIGETVLPAALQGFILKEDCDKYMRCNSLIQSYEHATKDISASSDNSTIKKFYSGASKCINTPLNAVANTDPGQISAKITHFIDLIEGKPVYASSTMTTPFTSSVLPNGKLFVIRLLAFRFVKKAESEILSEKKGFVPLAAIAQRLSRKFPEWGSLVQAYFYKLCPFLVPFNLPRGDLSLQEYCNSLGYDLKGSDSTLLNEMLARIKGYCSLYAIMVQTFEKSQQLDIGDATSFFTIGGVWEILTKTMRLDPQPDVTVMVYQTLLELLSDRLKQVYGLQFSKLMHVLTSGYLPKINNISVGASQSGVVRFHTFLEDQFRRR